MDLFEMYKAWDVTRFCCSYLPTRACGIPPNGSVCENLVITFAKNPSLEN
jgi:hypothetical protein